MQLIIEKRGYRLIPLLALAITIALMVLIAQDSSAVHNEGQLELDGNARYDGGFGFNPNTAAGRDPTKCGPAGVNTTTPVQPPNPPDCITTQTAFDWADDTNGGNGDQGVCKAGVDDPLTPANETNTITENTSSPKGNRRACLRDFVVASTADVSYHTGSDKDFQEIWNGASDDWGCVLQNNATNKSDLVNAYMVQTTPTSGPDAGHQLIYFGAERASENGSVYNGFWFLQGQVASDCPTSADGDWCDDAAGALNNTTCPGVASKHICGDVLILFNYDSGGRIGSIGAYQWVAPSPGVIYSPAFDVTGAKGCDNLTGGPDSNANGVPDNDEDNCTAAQRANSETHSVPSGVLCIKVLTGTGDCRINIDQSSPGDDLCGRVNGAPNCATTRQNPEPCFGPGNVPTPWAPGCATPGPNCLGPLAPPTFSEAGVDLTGLGIDIGCVATFIAESRSSPSVTATLKDYASSTSQPCGVSWEKRDESLTNHPLQGGATFTVTPNPFTGAAGALTINDCTSAPCPASNDSDPTAGSFTLVNILPANYQVCEATAPTGYARDNNLCRTLSVNAGANESTIGTQGTDDCANSDTNEQDFCNRLGSLEWEKRDDTGALQSGATFSVSPNPYACHSPAGTNPSPVSDDADGTDGPAGTGDEDGTGGQLKLDRVCIGTYTITEATAPTGFALDDDVTRTCQVTEAALVCAVGTQGTADDCPDATPSADGDETDFCNRLGSLEWEKRNDLGALQGGAQFSVSPNPFGCHGGTDPGTFTDNADPPDKDADAGQIKLERVCLGNYTITEETAPTGFGKDDDVTRACEVTATALTCVVGTQGTADDCPDATPSADGDETDFCNRLGSLEWEKRNDLGALQGGAQFSVSPNPFGCHGGTDPGTFTDNADPPDKDADAGQIKLERVCIGSYTITEETAPTGFGKDDDVTRTCEVTATALTCVVGTQGTADDCPDATPSADGDETDFCNRLGSLEWEKRNDLGALQGGAQFSVSPNPFGCHGGTDPGTFTDNADPPDKDADAGQIKLERVCIGSYTITEETAPTGFGKDDDVTRTCEVTATALTCVVGTQGTADDCPDATPSADGDETDFCNRLGSLEWEKRNDLGALQGGAQFSVSPNPFGCHGGTDPGTFTDNADPPDKDADAGQIKLERVCLGTYTVCEQAAPTGFARDDVFCRQNVVVSATDLAAAIGTQATADDCPDTTPDGDGDETDFCNRLGSLEWEKRSDVNGLLLAGATFEVTPNPFACRGAGSNPLVVTDDVSALLPDTNLVDDDNDGGQFKLTRVCMATYTITETIAPPGFAIDPDPTRVCQVDDPTFLGGSDELNCVVGTQGTDLTGNDDCPDADDGVDSDEADFCNLVGSLFWEKRGKDVSTDTVGNELLPGFEFTVTGTNINMSITDCIAGPCAATGDQDPDAGQFCLDTMPIGVLLTIDETGGPAGYVQTEPANNGDLTKTLDTSSTCAGGADGSTANDAGEFINQPLSKFKIDFICVAYSPSGSGECATAAKITCPDPATSPTPADATPDDFDDISETYGDGTTGLFEGTYQCEIVIDP